jgi:hypothetical protein
MTDIEQKAQSLFSQVLSERGALNRNIDRLVSAHEALFRAIEQHEAFKQEVSDAVLSAMKVLLEMAEHDCEVRIRPILERFIIPKTKPDPLVRVINEVIYAQPDGDISEVRMAKEIRAALDAVGLEIREKGQ